MTRLAAVCSLIVRADTIADVGCDHGKVAAYCVKNGLARRVIASDISDKCLDKARRNLAFADNVEFCCCDGITYDCDEAIIAGMGGMTVSDILGSAAVKPETLVICPHTDCEAVRRKLVSLDYAIEADFMCEERGKLYFVLRAKHGGARELSEIQYRYGVFADRHSELLQKYLLGLYKTFMLAPEHNKTKIESLLGALRLQGIAPTE